MSAIPYHEMYPGDYARNLLARDRELEYLKDTIKPGLRFRYWSVQRYDKPEWGDWGTVLDGVSAEGLANVLFDKDSEPQWMDGRLLHIEPSVK